MSERRPFFVILAAGRVFTFLFIATALVANIAYAADGDLDSSFGNGGIVSADFPYPIDAVGYTTAVQADARIVVVGSTGRTGGSFALSRLNPDGSADTSFGYKGSVITSFFEKAEAGSVVIQPDGKIIAAGYYDPLPLEYALARYNPDGSLDVTFGDGGKAKGSNNNGTLINDMRLLPDGKILVAGTTDAGQNRMWIARFNSNGSLDTTFSGDGMNSVFCNQLVDSNSTCEGFSLALQPDGKALVAGTLKLPDESGNRYYFAIARFTPGGNLDTSFDSDGLVTTAIVRQDRVYALAVTPENKILAVGYACCEGGGLAMARYNSNGSLDTTFGTGGKSITSNILSGYNLLLRPGGKILVPGRANTATNTAYSDKSPNFSFDSDAASLSDEQAKGPQAPSATRNFALFQFNSNGGLDSTFGEGGKAVTDFGGSSSIAYEVALSPGGKLVGAGTAIGNEADPKPLYRFAVARYNSNGHIDTSFDGDGKKTLSPLTSRSNVSNVAVQDDNKIVALAELGSNYPESSSGIETTYGLLRYNENGTPDNNFGVGGATIYTSTGTFHHVDLQSSGKPVVGGTIGGRVALMRFNQDGTPDSGFGDGGVAIANGPGYWQGEIDMAVQPDDKIIVVSSFGVGGYGQQDIALTRLNSDGSMDTSFDGDGLVTSSFGYINRAFALALQGNGKIVVAGSIQEESSTADREVLSLVRYNANGSVDTTFGDAGLARLTQIEDASQALSVALTPSGRIVASGYKSVDYNSQGLLVQLNANGSIDSSFGTGGIAYVNSVGYNLLVQHDGKLVVSSSPFIAPGALTRYLPNGSLDTSFGSGGVASQPQLEIDDLEMQQDGKIVAGGAYREGAKRIVGLARFIGGPPPVHEGHFQDVGPESPFYSYIECMGALNIISGYPCGGPGETCGAGDKPYFRPNNSMSRGQVSKIVSIAAGFDDAPTGQTFEDVPPGSTFHEYIERMAGRGIISGYACGGSPGEECVAPANRPYFRPAANVSRGQLTKIVSNSKGYTDTPTQQTFEDVPTTHPFYTFVERLVSRGVMSGYRCGSPGEPCQPPTNRPYFRPGMDVTRAQASKIVANSFFPDCQSATSRK